ncbi:hypothetical protein LQE88_07265 [Acidaminococcus sp. NSJ-142]|jgi:CRISPR type III-A/MTUBE-associated protein Csm6|uniref:type III-A CRISPR-associated CARF protein Csm6 n=1 Tax=Acidaminococcus TaxID=904 RepID=UPI000CF84B5F|nr:MULTISPECIES: hypothetical protein [Acidaminococcus]MCD2435785.1 hypothetical protein [Acidaminococcus hominis]MCH4097498.1 hypothetical protein [Acidaminococcus provencensis]RHJ99982.1 hypothetical protein DW089_09565 [Acidaminococcus sp. AM05-11]
MKILYSAVGDTDPIRDLRDGAILHIVRWYQPDKAVLFLSKEMTEKEEARQWYTKPILAVKPDCELELIKTDIVDVHKLDSLYRMTDEFYRLVDAYPEAEILLNTSSGTPQMKMILAVLAIEYDKAKAIQVSSPQKGSNRNTEHLLDTTPVEDIIEGNLDNLPEECENRCTEPKLRFIKYRQVARELVELVQAYSYKNAVELANKNRDILSQEVLDLVQHAYERSNLDYEAAEKTLSQYPAYEEFLFPQVRDKAAIKLREYLWVMEIRLKQDYKQDFFVKLSPFLYELLCFYITKKLQIPLEKFTGKKNYDKMQLSEIKENFPEYYQKLKDTLPYPLRDGQNLSYYYLELFLQTREEVPEAIKKTLQTLRNVESKIRNKQAHQIQPLTDADVKAAVGKSMQEIYQDIQAVFYFVLGDHYRVPKEMVYDQLNQKLEELLKAQV